MFPYILRTVLFQSNDLFILKQTIWQTSYKVLNLKLAITSTKPPY